MRKKILVLAFFAVAIIATQAASASGVPNSFINAELNIELEKQAFNAGETLNATITVSNSEAVPISNGIIITEIVQGKDYINPSQFAPADNIFAEEKISGINLRAGESQKFSYSFALPNDLREGDYRVEAYFKTELTHAVGIPAIFGSPRTASFFVKGKGEWPNLKIVRSETEFNGEIGPVGAQTEPGSTIKGNVFVENNSTKKSGAASLLVSLCEWDDSTCSKFDYSKEIEIGEIEAKKEKEIAVELQAPAIPGAYSIRLEVKENNRLVSFYRSRSIVTGATAKVRKISLNNFEFAAKEKVQMNVVIAPSPDHYTNPVFKDFDLKLELTDLETNKLLFSNSQKVSEISLQTAGWDYPEKSFSFTAQEPLHHFKVCATIEKSTVLDRQCVEFDASKFSKPKKESKVNVSWKYDYASNVLLAEFCNEPKETMLNAEYFIIEKGKENPITYETLAGNECLQKTIPLGLGAFELVLTDHNSKRQSTTEITIEELEASGFAAKTCEEIHGKKCSEGEICKSQTINAKDGACCFTECIDSASSTQTAAELPGWLSMIIVIIALLVVLGAVMRGKQNE